MTSPLVLRTRVRHDIERAARWYEDEREGLGAEYVAAVDRTLTAIERLPLRYPEAHKHVRRALVARFPYAAFFVVDPEQVVVLAILHQAADPSSWPGRA